MQFTRIPMAIVNSMMSFFKAYDYEEKLNELNLPVLESWRARDPYEPFLRSLDKNKDKPILAGLVFLKGRAKGDVQYLHEGMQKIGTGADSDIVIYSDKFSERQLNLNVTTDGVDCSSSHSDTFFFVNGYKSTSTNLVDQDEVQFSGASFYFIWLRGE